MFLPLHRLHRFEFSTRIRSSERLRSLLLLGTWSGLELVLLGAWSALDGCCCLGVLVAPDLVVLEFW